MFQINGKQVFEYTGFEATDGHGSVFVNKTKKNGYGLRYQVAGAWKKKGCTYPERRSFVWMKILVYRRDKGICQSCGGNCRSDGEVQHIIPKNGGGEVCGHNLVLLCRQCHIKTFKGRRYGGVPNESAQMRLEIKNQEEDE